MAKKAELDCFPPRIRAEPSSSGGFYHYSKAVRTLPPTKSIRLGSRSQLIDISALDSTHSTYSADSAAVTDFEMHRFSPSKDKRIDSIRSIASRTSLRSRPSLVTSFSDILVEKTEEELAELMPGKASKGCQTDVVFTKLNLDELTDYQRWIHKSVDPFFKEFKKHVLAQRPSNLEEFGTAYCLALANNGQLPIAVEKVEVPEVEKPTRNTISRQNSLIRTVDDDFGRLESWSHKK